MIIGIPVNFTLDHCSCYFAFMFLVFRVQQLEDAMEKEGLSNKEVSNRL